MTPEFSPRRCFLGSDRDDIRLRRRSPRREPLSASEWNRNSRPGFGLSAFLSVSSVPSVVKKGLANPLDLAGKREVRISNFEVVWRQDGA